LVSYTQLDQHGIKQVLVSSSGRPKAQSLQQEDADFYYEYDSRGRLKSKKPKRPIDKHADWYKNNVKYAKGAGAKSFTCQRITPLTPFESAMGVRSCIPEYRYHWCAGTHRDGYTYGCQERTFNEKDWEIFKQTHTIDYGAVEIIYSMDKPSGTWEQYFTDKANKLNLEIVSIANLEFREKQKPAVVEKTRPNPKEESIASVKIEEVKPVEVEPIKEAVKYSPLMIAGVIAVVVILLLKRRRA